MTQSKRKSRNKAAGETPANDGVGEDGKVLNEGGGKRKHGGGLSGGVTDSELVGKSDPESELKGKDEITEKMKKKKKKEKNEEEVKEKESGGDERKGNRGGEVRKGDKKAAERREDGDGAGGKLEEEVNKKKKKRKGTEDEMAERDVGENCGVGGRIKDTEDSMRKDESANKSMDNRGSRNEGGDRPKAIASSSNGRKVEEDEARKSRKKQRERKNEDGEKDEGDAVDSEKPGAKSGLLKKQEQRNRNENGDEKVRNGRKSNDSVRRSDPSIVISLSRSMQKSRRDSPNKKNKEKDEGNRKMLGEQKSESKKKDSSTGEIKYVSLPTSSSEEEPEEATKKAKKDNDDGGSGLKKERMSRGKTIEKDPKTCSLPLNRVRTIIRSNNSNSKIAQETYILICKATECFIDQFCEDAFELAASRGLKNVLKYEHLCKYAQSDLDSISARVGMELCGSVSEYKLGYNEEANKECLSAIRAVHSEQWIVCGL